VPGDSAVDPIRQILEDFVGEGPSSLDQVPRAPAIFLGVVTSQGQKTYGLARAGQSQTPNEETLFPVNSISKMLTGLMLADAVSKGQLQLSNRLDTLLRADLGANTGPRTLGQAIAHFASYRENPQNLNFANTDSPAQAYTRQQLATCLADPACSASQAPIGSRYEYGNLAPGLVALALMDHFGKTSYADLLAEKLITPLQLESTFANWDLVPAGAAYLKGTRLDGSSIPQPATMGVLTGAGGVISNGRDMMRLLGVLLKPSADWQGTVSTATTPIRPGIAYSIDLMDDKGLLLYSKSGETAGYSSMIMWNAEHQVGVIAFSNVGRSSTTLAKLSRRIIQHVANAP
jgi:CubicO group peptidase (beta-lactamase class C family)